MRAASAPTALAFPVSCTPGGGHARFLPLSTPSAPLHPSPPPPWSRRLQPPSPAPRTIPAASAPTALAFPVSCPPGGGHARFLPLSTPSAPAAEWIGGGNGRGLPPVCRRPGKP